MGSPVLSYAPTDWYPRIAVLYHPSARRGSRCQPNPSDETFLVCPGASITAAPTEVRKSGRYTYSKHLSSFLEDEA